MNDPFKLPNTIGGNSTSNKKAPTQNTRNFIESFREQGNAATAGVFGEAKNQLFGGLNSPQRSENTPNPNQQPQFNFEEFLKQREQKIRQQERNLSQEQRRTEKVIFLQKENNAKKELESILIEIKKISETSSDIAIEVVEAQKSIMANPVEVGIYHITLYQRIRRHLILAKKRMSEAKYWLQMFNNRKVSKSAYWGKAKKHGTTYTLSNERTVATQTG
jgi:hypothetical protein